MTDLDAVRAHLAEHPDGVRGSCCRELLVDLAEHILATTPDPPTLTAVTRAGWCDCCHRPRALPQATRCFSCLGHAPDACPWRGAA